jgi:hypothetical protein
MTCGEVGLARSEVGLARSEVGLARRVPVHFEVGWCTLRQGPDRLVYFG